jgi:hypothetical protein
MRRNPVIATAAVLVTCGAALPTLAATPVGLYIGGAAGRGNVRLDQTPAGGFLDFDESHLGWKALIGIRPIPFLGAEAEYVDFGNPDTTIGPVSTDVRARAFGISAVGFIPITPIFDIFGKAGGARLQTTANGTVVGGAPCQAGFDCGLFRLDTTDTRFMYGAGFQVGAPAFKFRLEYQRISASNGDPSLLSAGLIWTF